MQGHAGIDNLGVRVGRMRRGAGRRDACMPACARARESYIIFKFKIRYYKYINKLLYRLF